MTCGAKPTQAQTKQNKTLFFSRDPGAKTELGLGWGQKIIHSQEKIMPEGWFLEEADD